MDGFGEASYRQPLKYWIFVSWSGKTWPVKTSILIMGLLSFLFAGCNKPSDPSAQTQAQTPESKALQGPPEVASESEEGFHDLLFFIRDFKEAPDGSRSIRAEGLHKGKPLAMEIILGPTWKSGTLGDVIKTHQGTVTCRSVGADSDSFVQALDELYGTKLNPDKMATETRFTGISLQGDPGKLSGGPTKIKMFFESDVEGAYAEFFTNIELDKHRVEVREKDEGYRAAVIKALQGKIK